MNIGAIDLPAIAASVLFGIKQDGDERRLLTLEELRSMSRGGLPQIQAALTEEEQHTCLKLGWSYEAYLLEKIRQMEEIGDKDGDVAASLASLSADEIAACAKLGVSHADFLKAKADQQISVAAAARSVCRCRAVTLKPSSFTGNGNAK